MRTVTLNTNQQRGVEILTRLDAGALEVGAAAELLGVTPRQVRRLRARFRQEGFQAVVHGNRGRAPANRTDPDLVEQILALVVPGGKYHDLNVCHLHERLDQEGRLVIARSTLDRLLKQAGLRHKAQTSAPVHRRRRPRRPAEGMLLQIDGSPFDWLEGRGPKASLIGAIDDATGKIVFLVFRLTEDQVGYLLLLRTVALSYGLPMSIYHDRHTILRSPKQPTLEEELAGQPPMGQILRLLPDPKGPSLVDKSVTVHVVPEGDVYLYHDRHSVAYRRVLASDPVPLKPRREMVRQPRPVDPKATARRRGWLFAQG